MFDSLFHKVSFSISAIAFGVSLLVAMGCGSASGPDEFGDSTDDAPTARPPINRATISSKYILGRADSTAERVNKSADKIRILFRPNLSLITPAKLAPIMQPIMRLLTVNPS